MAQKKSSPSRGNQKKYHLEMTSLSLLFWGFCLCFLLTWVFVLGVLVGRGFLPNAVSTISELKAQVARLQGLVTHSKPANPIHPKGAEADPKLAFYDNLAGKKEEVKKKAPQAEKAAPPRGDTPQRKPETPPSAQGDTRKAEEPVAARKTGEMVTVPSSSGTLLFTVQLASLEDRTKAEATIQSLRARGFDGYFYEVKVKGKTFYRVRCGKFRTREEAALHAKKLTDLAGMNGFVTKID